MDLGLQGKTTIVTGASGVIGRGLVQRFTEEGHILVKSDAWRVIAVH